MRMALFVTPLFVFVFLVFQVVITNVVGFRRVKTDIHFLDGGDLTLTRRMRAHGNFTETVPISLVAMLTAELMGAAATVLWIGGVLLLVGRTWHYWVIVTQGWGNGRALSMVLTFASMLTFAGAILWNLG
jgi:uncharacterized membrane protein YecN with MAPEG domain